MHALLQEDRSTAQIHRVLSGTILCFFSSTGISVSAGRPFHNKLRDLVLCVCISSDFHWENRNFTSRHQFMNSQLTLLPKEQWKSDGKVANCNHCDKQFFPVYRRKHHCRRCGNVFCSDCSSQFLDGSHFGPRAEKKVRLCNRCYEQVVKLLKLQQDPPIRGISVEPSPRSQRHSLHNEPQQPILISSKSVNIPKSPSKPPEEQLTNDLEFNPDVEQVSISSLFVAEETIKSKDGDMMRQQLKEKANAQLEAICEYCLKTLIQPQKDGVVEMWKDKMVEFIKRAVEDIEYSTLNGDPMDINCYVKTKTIPYFDHSMTGYFKGVVFRKNVALKKMAISYDQPKIMIIVGALDMNDTQTQFEDFIAKEFKTLKEYVEKIKEHFAPNLILVEKSANKVALDLCFKHGIAVVHNIKLNLIRKIAKCTEAKYVKLEKLDDYVRKKSKVIGTCERIIFRNFPKPSSDKDSIKDSTLMFIETKDGHNGVTITLSGPQEDLLAKLKQCIVGCMRLAKHFEVERHMLLTELKLKAGKSYPSAGDFSKFLFEKLQLKEMIRADFAYVKVNYVSAAIHNFNDIKDLQQLQQYQKDFALEKQNQIVEFFAEMCGLPGERSRSSYHSSDDISLGAFIILKVSNMENKCEVCQLKRNSHVSIYYSGGKYCRIIVERSMLHDSLRKQISMQSQSEDEGKLYTHKDVARILIQNHQNNTEKKKIRIETFIECNICIQKLTESVALSQQNLEYSFLRFLQHLFLTPPQNLPEKKKPHCEHQQLQRVFSYDNSVVKVMVGDAEVYSTSLLNYADQSIQEYVQKWEVGFIKQKKEELLQRVSIIASQLVGLIPKSLQKQESELLQKTIKQLKEEIEKTIQDLQPQSFFQLDQLSHETGMQLKTIYQKILDHKKKKELNPELKNIIQQKIMDNNLIRTAQDLDRIDHSEKIHSAQSTGSQQNTDLAVEVQVQLVDNVPEEAHPMLSDLLIPQSDPECHTPLGGKPQPTPILKAQQNSLRDLDKPLEQLLPQEKEFNFQKEWNLCSFLVEQSKITKNQCFYEFVPIYENQPLSYLAFAINHPRYYSEIYIKEQFKSFEELGKGPEQAKGLGAFLQTQRVEPKQAELVMNSEQRYQSVDFTKMQQDRDCFILRINYDQDIVKKLPEKSPNLTAFQPKESIIQDDFSERSVTYNTLAGQSMMGQGGNNFQTRKSKYAEILIYFPTQFEALRMLCGITTAQFIKSISSTSSWGAQGGKSASKFYKSSDELFIFKKLEQDKEFLMFKKFALDYFRHMQRHLQESKPSLLSKIFGMFEIRDRGSTEYYLVMENLFFGMGESKDLHVYDLKGSETNRLEKKKRTVLLDTNFRIDRNAEPIPIVKENFRYNDRAFQSDCKFLNKQNVIDYSLLLIIDQKNHKLRMGIIDYLRFYTWDKETEHYLKYLLKGGMVENYMSQVPTIVNPADYKKRFLGAMSKYFIQI